ncbi:MAG: hypothetical protein ABFQ53_03785 [Patescibacteria group bacterium]
MSSKENLRNSFQDLFQFILGEHSAVEKGKAVKNMFNSYDTIVKDLELRLMVAEALNEDTQEKIATLERIANQKDSQILLLKKIIEDLQKKNL